MTHLKLLAPLALALSLGAAAAAPTALNLTATGTGYDGPDHVQAGYVQVNLNNASKVEAGVDLFRLKPGVTEAQFKAALTAVALESAKDADAQLNQLVEAVGGADAQPGQTNSVTVHLLPGMYYLSTTNADDDTHVTALSQGYYRALTVTGPELSNAPDAADYTLDMLDYHFALPADVTAGTHTWHITNSGAEPHFALVAKLMPGKTMDDVMKALSDPSAPPPVDFSQSVEAAVITTSQAEDVTWNLAAGDYVVVCFVQDKNGVSHAMLGMAQGLSVH